MRSILVVAAVMTLVACRERKLDHKSDDSVADFIVARLNDGNVKQLERVLANSFFYVRMKVCRADAVCGRLDEQTARCHKEHDAPTWLDEPNAPDVEGCQQPLVVASTWTLLSSMHSLLGECERATDLDKIPARKSDGEPLDDYRIVGVQCGETKDTMVLYRALDNEWSLVGWTFLDTLITKTAKAAGVGKPS